MQGVLNIQIACLDQLVFSFYCLINRSLQSRVSIYRTINFVLLISNF